MTEKLKRPAKYVPLSIRFATGKTGTRLLEQFGLEGLAVWAALLAAAKENEIEGEFNWASEPEAWSKLGLSIQPASFTFDEFVLFTGRIRATQQSDRRRAGRVRYVRITSWERWHEVRKTQDERERKSRYRLRKDRDKVPDESQESPSDVPPKREREKGEEEGSKGRAVVRLPSAYSLPFSQERIVLQILEAVGADQDNGTPDVIRKYAVHLPEGSLAKVLESVASSRKRNRAEYVVGALKSECAERGIAV